MTPCAVEASGRGSSITPPLRPAHASRLISEKRALIHDSGPIQLETAADTASLGRDRTHAVPVRSVGPCGYPAAYTQDPAARRSDSRYDDPRRGSRVVREVARTCAVATRGRGPARGTRRGREYPPGRTRRGGGTALARGRQRRRVRGVPCTNRPRAGRVVVRNRRGIVRFSRVTVAALSHLQENRRCPRALHFTARLLSKLSFFLAQHLPHGGLTALCNLFDEGQPGSFGALQW